MNKLTTKKHMQMQTWWAPAGARIKWSKVNFFNFVQFSRLINFVHRKTSKYVGSGRQTTAPIEQQTKKEKKNGSCWFSNFDNFLSIFLKPKHSK